MRGLRFSLASIAFATVVVALDCELVRVLVQRIDHESELVIRTGLVMANLLAVVVWKIFQGRRQPQPFLLGFGVCGLAALVGHEALNRVSPFLGFRYQFVIEECVGHMAWVIFPSTVRQDFLASTPYALAVVYLFVFPVLTAVMAAPQILVAVTGGILARRWLSPAAWSDL